MSLLILKIINIRNQKMVTFSDEQNIVKDKTSASQSDSMPGMQKINTCKIPPNLNH